MIGDFDMIRYRGRSWAGSLPSGSGNDAGGSGRWERERRKMGYRPEHPKPYKTRAF